MVTIIQGPDDALKGPAASGVISDQERRCSVLVISYCEFPLSGPLVFKYFVFWDSSKATNGQCTAKRRENSMGFYMLAGATACYYHNEKSLSKATALSCDSLLLGPGLGRAKLGFFQAYSGLFLVPLCVTAVLRLASHAPELPLQKLNL